MPPETPGRAVCYVCGATAGDAMPKFAANLSTLFCERPFLNRFAAARAAGFEAVEHQFPYAFPAKDIAARLADAGLVNVLHNLPAGDWAAGERGVACLPGREREFRDGVARAIDYALATGTPKLNCIAGIAPAGADRARLRDVLFENLAHAASALKAAGLTLLIEPINTRDMPGFFLNTTAQALDVVARAGADNLSVQFDAYHMEIMEGRVADTVEAHLGSIGHVQIADHPGRHEPGTGTIDFADFFDRLDRIGYAGWVGCEYSPAGDTAAGLGWMPRLSPSAARRRRPRGSASG